MTMCPLPQINGLFNFQTSFKFYSAPSFFLTLHWETTTLQTFLYQAGPSLNLCFDKQSPCWVLVQATLIMIWKFDLKSVVRSCPKAKLSILVPNSHAFRLYRTRLYTLCEEWKVRSWKNLRLGRLSCLYTPELLPCDLSTSQDNVVQASTDGAWATRHLGKARRCANNILWTSKKPMFSENITDQTWRYALMYNSDHAAWQLAKPSCSGINKASSDRVGHTVSFRHLQKLICDVVQHLDEHPVKHTETKERSISYNQWYHV